MRIYVTATPPDFTKIKPGNLVLRVAVKKVKEIRWMFGGVLSGNSKIHNLIRDPSLKKQAEKRLGLPLPEFERIRIDVAPSDKIIHFKYFQYRKDNEKEDCTVAVWVEYIITEILKSKEEKSMPKVKAEKVQKEVIEPEKSERDPAPVETEVTTEQDQAPTEVEMLVTGDTTSM